MVALDTRNKPPVFMDQDTVTPGRQNESTTRKVEENTKAVSGDDSTTDDNTGDNVGSAVMAEDPDPNVDPLIYTLSGADASLFRVRDNGQIEVGAGTKLDYETRTTYMVTVKAADSFGDSATIPVTINVTDLDDKPTVTGDAAIEYAEKGMGAVATYTAVDPEMTDIVRWSLSGTDAGKFEIDGGVLTFEKSPDFEKPGDVVGTGTSTAAAGDNVYEVTVQATDETGKTGKKEVKVTVTNVEEPGKVTLSAVQPQSDVELTADHSDPDLRVTDLKWQWAKSSRQNGSYTDIEDAISSAYTPVDADKEDYLRVTASYTDGEDSGKSAMAVSAYAVQGVRGGNRAPVFPDQDSDMTGDQSTVATER